jgi:hypothetical protein
VCRAEDHCHISVRREFCLRGKDPERRVDETTTDCTKVRGREMGERSFDLLVIHDHLRDLWVSVVK